MQAVNSKECKNLNNYRNLHYICKTQIPQIIPCNLTKGKLIVLAKSLCAQLQNTQVVQQQIPIFYLRG